MDPEDGLGLHPRIVYEAPKDGTNMEIELLNAFKEHANKTLLVDTASQKQWTGAQLLDQVGRIATGLVREVGIKPNDIIMTICEHTSHEILVALGVVLAGGALYGTCPKDGYKENKVLCELDEPNVIILNGKLHQTALALKQNVNGLYDTRIVWMDEPQTNGHSNHVIDENNNCEAINDKHTKDGNNTDQIIRRDGVVLFKDLMNGPLDLELIFSLHMKNSFMDCTP